MRAAVYSIQPYERRYFDMLNIENKHELVYFEAPLNADTADLTKGFEAVCIFVCDRLNSEAIDKLAKNGVKLINLRSAGYNHVDIEAAKRQNIVVLRVPAYPPQAVAEQAVALILSLNRKIHKVYNRVREGNFSLEGLMGFNLYGKTVGIVGTGKIGTAFCKIMLGFGCKVVAYDIVESGHLKAQGVEYMDLDGVLKVSDIISLHCPLTPVTHYLFDRGAFDKIKKGAMLINTSRGGLINTKHAIEALKTGKLGFLGIDVYEQEEGLFFKNLSEIIIQDDLIERLMTFHNVLITPHQGFFTDEAVEQIIETTLQNFTNFENNAPLDNEVV